MGRVRGRGCRSRTQEGKVGANLGSGSVTGGLLPGPERSSGRSYWLQVCEQDCRSPAPDVDWPAAAHGSPSAEHNTQSGMWSNLRTELVTLLSSVNAAYTRPISTQPVSHILPQHSVRLYCTSRECNYIDHRIQ